MSNKKTDNAEEKILGQVQKKEIVTPTNYESKAVIYRVTNVTSPNTPIIVRGNVIETFIGYKNPSAREGLKSGKKNVYTYDINGQKQYKIEVLGK